MTLVELVEALRTEGGLSGAPLTTVQDVTGETLRLRNWIVRSWLEIQAPHPDWRFLRGRFAFRATAKDYRYTASFDAGLTDFKAWKLDSFTCYLEASGQLDQQLISRIDYRDWYYLYGLKRTSIANASLLPLQPDGTTVATTDGSLSLTVGSFSNWADNIDTSGLSGGRPVWFAEAPDRSIVFAPIPNDNYIIAGEYFRKPQTLLLDEDTPLIPDEMQMVIVYHAMRKLAAFESDASLMSIANSGLRPLLAQLHNDWLPEMQMATLDTM